MASLDEIKSERLEKLGKLKETGIDPYPGATLRTADLKTIFANFDDRLAAGEAVTVAGRVMAIRGQGAIVFINIFDGTATIQGLLKQDEMEEAVFNLFTDTVDIGDFVELSGLLFVTNRGEKTVKVKTWKMLTKTLLPLPEKWHGLTDEEARFRKRYLDILMNPAVREMIELKAKFWQFTRNYLVQAGFIEVETPTLEITTGGAEANPFKTHHDDYDLDVYLRISVGELWQKKLLAAGLPRTFEIGRVYRNEGTSPDHAQEFTNLEFYAAYMDLEGGIKLTEELIRGLVRDVFGKTVFSTRGFTFEFPVGAWPRIEYVAKVKEMTGLDVLSASEEEMKDKLDELGVKYTGDNRERLTDTLWKYCRKQIAGPAWLVGHPKLVSPLAKARIDNPDLTNRVQLILAGAEATNGFSELNNPLDQRARFELQQQLIDRGDKEAMMPDWEFVEMLEHGMPPAFGNGFGERLLAILLDKPLRETQIFPLMRPKDLN
ncbi:MAG: lysine--tRNA ligase [Candidatus Vogelbacteria bacterium RIFOXYD1_FULL_44_32]|uniref:Lysine--tRNA ligase n=1 Tax=Candidatus Vogelbacteria bacterium RIFOXYD1_FULL_44_32 TaxID=1802438 RepID=A0A1G2QDL2_9BACT|nr:MAG: lysine--tRNA ligase [Candidatus Vogelbacteria bacterium RIFOXYD1_FULL_44_32]